jgi:hypothetical protein
MDLAIKQSYGTMIIIFRTVVRKGIQPGDQMSAGLTSAAPVGKEVAEN